jgi:protein-disulfide isomerase
MNKNSIIMGIIAAVVLIGFLGVVYMATNSSGSSSNNPLEGFKSDKVYEDTTKVLSTDHVKWSTAKKHILVEYGDLQCPGCQQAFLYDKANLDTDKTITDNVTFVFRHYPLDIHKNSHVAAYAAEAAGMQGKFFEFVDVAYTNQDTWAEGNNAKDYFVQVAKDLKLDVDKFKKDMDSDVVKKKIQDNIDMGNTDDLTATPTFYFDGKKVDTATFDDFKQLMLKIIQADKPQQTTATGSAEPTASESAAPSVPASEENK